MNNVEEENINHNEEYENKVPTIKKRRNNYNSPNITGKLRDESVVAELLKRVDFVFYFRTISEFLIGAFPRYCAKVLK